MGTLSREDKECTDDIDKTRLISGIVVRASYDARRSTDRVMLLTIETIQKINSSLQFIEYIYNCLRLDTERNSILIRRNAVGNEGGLLI